MPNGGMLPCCHACKWKAASKTLGEVYCTRHQVQIRHALFTFCSELSEDTVPGLADFIASGQFEPETIYAWIEIGYLDPSYRSLPRYYAEHAPLAPVKEFAQWTNEEELRIRRAQDEQLKEKLKRQSKDSDS